MMIDATLTAVLGLAVYIVSAVAGVGLSLALLVIWIAVGSLALLAVCYAGYGIWMAARRICWKTAIVTVAGFGLLMAALVAEVAAGSVPSWDMEGTMKPIPVEERKPGHFRMYEAAPPASDEPLVIVEVPERGLSRERFLDSDLPEHWPMHGGFPEPMEISEFLALMDFIGVFWKLCYPRHSPEDCSVEEHRKSPRIYFDVYHEEPIR